MRITLQNRYMIFALAALVAMNYMLLALAFHDISILRTENEFLKKTSATKTSFEIGQFSVIDPNITRAVIEVESDGDPYAYNQSSGAVGLMQLTPVIYKNLCGLTKEEAFAPDRNVACGSLFLSHLLKKYRGNVEKALLHYNNGHIITNMDYPVKVQKELQVIVANAKK